LEPISLLLESRGFDTFSTNKGDTAVEKIKAYKPDLVLLDVLMAGSDGREICRVIKSDSEIENTPVVMMSAHPGAEKDSLISGADDFIAKPFETEDLISTIKKNIDDV
jgi:DNA-binding response OmpR family regulator